MDIRTINPDDAQARALIAHLDSLMASLYPAESNHLDSTDELKKPNVLFLGAFDGGELTGCGAVKILDDDGDYGEIKRVFVSPQHRGRGISRLIMERLEGYLVDSGIYIAPVSYTHLTLPTTVSV